MKKNPFQTLVALMTVASMMVVPVSAFAREGVLEARVETPELKLTAQADAKVKGSAGATFCDFIKEKSVDDFRHFGERSEKMDERRDNRDNVIAELRAKMDDKRSENQTERQAKMDELMVRWEANAKTDAERAALVEFKTELQAAIGDRQDSTSDAVAQARQDKDALRSDVRAKIDAEVAKLGDVIKGALDRAQTDCANNVSSATVRTNFAADVKSATDAFKTAVATIKADAKTDASTIREDRKKELEQSRSQFRGFFETLRARFQALFGIKTKGEVEVTDN